MPGIGVTALKNAIILETFCQRQLFFFFHTHFPIVSESAEDELFLHTALHHYKRYTLSTLAEHAHWAGFGSQWDVDFQTKPKGVCSEAGPWECALHWYFTLLALRSAGLLSSRERIVVVGFDFLLLRSLRETEE